MEKNPEDRFQTGAALADVLRQHTGQAIETPAPAPPPDAERPVAPPKPPSMPERPPVAEEIPQAKRETPPPQPKEQPQPAPRTRAKKSDQKVGWTGAFVYRSSTKVAEIPDAPAASLPVPAREQKPVPKEAKPSPDKKARKPRARTAAKIWFVIGLLAFVYYVIDHWVPTLENGGVAFNILCLTPALTGALVTLFSKSKKKKGKVVRGILLGALVGLALSLTLTVAFAAVTLGEAFDVFAVDSVVVQFILAASAASAAVSGTITGLALGIRSLFSSS